MISPAEHREQAGDVRLLRAGGAYTNMSTRAE